MNRSKRRIVIVLLILLVLIIPPFWIIYREYRQARLDHALITAIKAGDDQKALEALAEGASGEARDTGKSPTFKEALRHLLDHFRHPGKKEEAHNPALLLLYQKAFDNVHGWGSGPSPMLVCTLLDHGAEINDRDEDGRSPLFNAIFFSNNDIVRLLLERGAEIEETDNQGSTPLMWANDRNTRVLLEHGANMEAVTSGDNLTALLKASNGGAADKVRILLEHGAKVGAKDALGFTALDYARANTKQQIPDSPKIVAILKQYGAK